MSQDTNPEVRDLSEDEQRFIQLMRLIPDQTPVIDLIMKQAALCASPEAIAELLAAFDKPTSKV